MEDQNVTLLQKLFKYNNLLIRYHHHHHGSGPQADTMRGQGRVLSILKMKREMTQKELSYLLDMRVQSLSELLSKLEGKGHITRTPLEEDRRVMVIRLTDEGAAAAENAKQPHSNELLQCLSEEEQQTLSGYLDRMIASIEEQCGKADKGHHDHQDHHGHGHHHGGMGHGCRGGHARPPFEGGFDPRSGMGWNRPDFRDAPCPAEKGHPEKDGEES